ncbi:MAG: methylated-DNA--[protein]-cysteine S-methyltransferase [Cyanobacteria bacterium J06643_13]
MTPKKYQEGGKGIKIVYSTVKCDLGHLLVATTERGICAVKLGDLSVELTETLKQEFFGANLIQDDNQHRDWIEHILQTIAGQTADLDLPLDIRGTAFQQQVWQALRLIPRGETRNYAEIARAIDKPQATRAVGSACGANPVAVIIPCHRVLRSDGSLGGYRWGIERKQKLLEIERQH